MRLPARGEKCTHISCFEAENYYWMNSKFKQWKCPICGIHTYPLAHDLSNLKRVEVIRILMKEITDDLEDESKDIDSNDKSHIIINNDLTVTIGVRTFILTE